MLALVVVLLVVVALLCVVVTGLLRSHADIVRALHSLGVGVGDPVTRDHPGAVAERPVHLRDGPPLPAERSSTSVHDLEGVTPEGDAVVVSMASSDFTLLAFLSSGCTSCAAFWAALADPAQRSPFPIGTRFVAVTKGPEWESPATVARWAAPELTVVMSTTAWGAYEVPGSPYFALVDGRSGVRIGEGVAEHLSQIADLVSRAASDERAAWAADSQAPGTQAPGTQASQSRAAALGLSGAEREAHNDAVLRSHGIGPGHPSLYPRRLEDVFVPAAGAERDGDGTER